LIVALLVSICRCSKPGKKLGIVASISLTLCSQRLCPGQCFYEAQTVSEMG
jgi:hypothetical protein